VNREIASAKLYASEMLARVTDTTLQIFGGMRLMDDIPIERFWRDARTERIWDGTAKSNVTSSAAICCGRWAHERGAFAPVPSPLNRRCWRRGLVWSGGGTVPQDGV